MSKAFVKIQNEGEIDTMAFRLMGATTKAGDESKIGYFGSGIKYAVATALRMGVPLRIFSGKKEVKITTKPVTMRGQKFDVVHIDGEATSITTEMGRDWKAWFIFREFYCNAIDEGNDKLEVSDAPKGEDGKTIVFLGLDATMKPIFDSLDRYFSTRRVAFYEMGGTRVYPRLGEHVTVYRKGICVYNEAHKSIYDYDFPVMDINEARVASDWDIKYKVCNFWKDSASLDMIEQLYNNVDSMEFGLDWDMGYTQVSNSWLEALKGKVIIPREQSGYFASDMMSYHVMLPHDLCVILHKKFGKQLTIRGMESGKKEIIEVGMTEREEKMVKDAVAFLKKSEIFVDLDSYPIKTAIFERARQIGAAHEGTIYLSKNVFQMGRRMVVETILEEYTHLKQDVLDETREMQNVLIRFVVSTLETSAGEYL